jgi:hypothetical protein
MLPRDCGIPEATRVSSSASSLPFGDFYAEFPADNITGLRDLTFGK